MKKARPVAFITRDSRTRRLRAIFIEMGYACDPKTVRNVMNALGYNKCVPRTKFNVKPNKPKRFLGVKPDCIGPRRSGRELSGESSFSTGRFGHCPWVIRKPDEGYHPDCVDSKFRSGQKIKMVWGAFCGTTKSDLISVFGKAKLDSATYVRMTSSLPMCLFASVL